MKHMFPILVAVLFGSMVFTSCAKRYTCTCTDVTTGKPTYGTITAKSRDKAKAECEKLDDGNLQFGNTDCHLR